jgi:hypothetical protein
LVPRPHECLETHGGSLPRIEARRIVTGLTKQARELVDNL